MQRLSIKRRIAQQQTLFGVFCMGASFLVADVLAGAGFDFIVLDAEHAAVSLPLLQAQAGFAEANGAAVLVRSASRHEHVLKPILDIGFDGVLVPTIRTARDAQEAVRSVRYPPLGKRGIGGCVRATNYGRDQAYYQRANNDVALLLLVESQEGVANLDEILAVPGIDGVYFGPGDFASDAQIHAGQTSEEVMQVMGACIKRVRSAGLIAGIQAREPQIARYREEGANVMGIGADMQLLASAADQLASRWCAPAKVHI